MTDFSVFPLRTNSIAYLYRMRNSIEIDPVYQRQGEVWSKKKQQLLIDSIINRFDVPKIYFHEHPTPKNDGVRQIKYSIIDGRQRLEAVWDFMDGKFALASDFALLEDGSKVAAGKTYSELEEDIPEIAAVFEASPLDVMLIRTDDIELIEEMFSRLNEAVPLNAAEKRNGKGGYLRPVVRDLVADEFFVEKLPFGNSRYRHFDLATKFLYWIEQGGAADTKKQRLDEFWNEVKADPGGQVRARELYGRALEVVSGISPTFERSDKLLASVGMVSVYFLLGMRLIADQQRIPRRAELELFEEARKINRFNDEDELSGPQRRLLEFDRRAQSPNDEGALSYRVSVLEEFLENPRAFLEVGSGDDSPDSTLE